MWRYCASALDDWLSDLIVRNRTRTSLALMKVVKMKLGCLRVPRCAQFIRERTIAKRRERKALTVRFLSAKGTRCDRSVCPPTSKASRLAAPNRSTGHNGARTKAYQRGRTIHLHLLIFSCQLLHMISAKPVCQLLCRAAILIFTF